MIWLTRVDGSPLLLNDDQILYLEVQGDTLLSLADGSTLRVLESAEEITRRIECWRRRILGLSLLGAEELEEEDRER